MQGAHLLGLFLIVTIILVIVIIYRGTEGEGFGSVEDSAHSTFVDKYAQKYSNMGVALSASKNEKVLGGDTKGIFGNIGDMLTSAGSTEQKIHNPFPVEGDRSGMYAIIDKCQAVKAIDCNVFDQPDFTSTCGMCLDIGTDSENKPVTGGLVLTASDRDYAKTQQRGRALPPYIPTVGTCPAGKFVSNKKECIVLKNQLECAKGSTFDKPTGCSQCYDDVSYSVVNPDDPNNPNPDLIKGYGTLNLYGEGTLRYKQASDNNFNKARLSKNKPIVIPLAGPEYENTLTLNVIADIMPLMYDSRKVYAVEDRVIYRGSVFTMVEGAGVAGYAPDRQGDKLWKRPGIPINSFKPPPPVYLMGYLEGQTGKGGFIMDVYGLILSDSFTGRKPRTSGSVIVNGNDITILSPGYGKPNMSLTMKPLLTFVDTTSEESVLCPSSPFVTKAASATLLGSDPCYRKGAGPGSFSLECLQNLFITNGCMTAGTGYPSSLSKAAKLMVDVDGNTLNLNDIANKIYSMAVLSSSGNDINGTKATMADWSAASEFCTGKSIKSPCDTSTRDTGPLTPDCLNYLWENRGENNPEGATYYTPPNARSLFSSGKTNRFCTHDGMLAPSKTQALTYWQGQGGVAAVKAEMKNIHLTANDTTLTEKAKKTAIGQCYGISPSAVGIFKSNWKSDAGVNNDVYRAKGIGNVSYIHLGYGPDFINLSQLSGFNGDGKNVTIGRSVSGPDAFSGNITRAVDGTEVPRSYPGIYHSSGPNQVFEVKLDGPTDMTRVVVYNRRDCCSDRMKGHVIKFLDENKNVLWTSPPLNSELVQTITVPKRGSPESVNPPKILLRASNYLGSDPWKDESGNGRHATLEYGKAAKNFDGNGIVLDGATSWKFPNVGNLNNTWTVVVWYKKTGPPGGGKNMPSIITSQRDFQRSYHIPLAITQMDGSDNGPYAGNFVNVMENPPYRTGAKFFLPNGTWTNIQITWDGPSKTMTTYIDGSILGSDIVQSHSPSKDVGDPFTIGRASNYLNFVTGEIGEVRIYDYPLNSDQVETVYKSSVGTYNRNVSVAPAAPVVTGPPTFGAGWNY